MININTTKEPIISFKLLSNTITAILISIFAYCYLFKIELVSIVFGCSILVYSMVNYVLPHSINVSFIYFEKKKIIDPCLPDIVFHEYKISNHQYVCFYNGKLHNTMEAAVRGHGVDSFINGEGYYVLGKKIQMNIPPYHLKEINDYLIGVFKSYNIINNF